MSRVTFIGLIFVFAFLSFVAFRSAMPETKNKKVMNMVAPYMPFKLEKRLAGLTIINTKTGAKEKPSNDVVFKRLDELEKEWGKKHLKVENGQLFILDDANRTEKSFILKDKKQVDFIHKFFGI